MPKPPPPPGAHKPPSQAKQTKSYRFTPATIEALERYAAHQGVGPNAAIEHLVAWALVQAGEAPKAPKDAAA